MKPAALVFALAALVPAAARAGETACWFEQGVIVAPASIAGLAGDKFSFKASAVLATLLAVGSYLAFVVALKLQFPVWPTFIA